MFGFLFAATYILGGVLMHEFLEVLHEIEPFEEGDKEATKIATMLQSCVWPYYVIKATLFYKKGE